MTRARAFRWLALLLVLLVVPLPAGAQSKEERRKREVDSALGATAADFHASSQDLAQAGQALHRLAVQVPAAQRAYAQAQGRLRAARDTSRVVAAQAEGARAAAASAEAAARAAESALADARADVAGIVRSAYMLGPLGGPGAVLEAGSVTEALDRHTFLQALTAHQRDRLSLVDAARSRVAARRADARARAELAVARDRSAREALARVERLTADVAASKRALEERVAEQRHARRVAEREKAADLARYRALQAEQRRLAALIKAQQSRGTGRVGKGGLLWPTDGPITSRYGYRTHPIYGYRRFHAGIDIGAPTGQVIVAARTGRVVHAGPLGSYGNLVVVDHGDGFSTAYAHQSRIAVSDGQRVRAGQAVGYVGSTGASTGPHLHYETRVNGEPVDPMRYY
jgi:murein DD-endopeptidase MepM/ murein hydrolase activator NlpD